MRLALRTGWAALLLVAGVWPLSGAWTGTTAPVALAGAAVAPVVLLAAGTRLRLPVGLVTMVLVLATGTGAYLVAGSGGADPVAELRDAVPRLLTAPRPAPDTPGLLLPGVLLAVLIGLWVGLRTLPEPRPGGGLVAAPAGGLAFYAAGALLSAGTADPHGAVAGAMVVVAAAGWLGLGGPRAPLPAAIRWLAPVAALAAAVALLAAAAAPTDRFEPRHLVDPPRSDLEVPSPLPRIAGWHQMGDAVLLRVEAGPETRLRLVTLPDFTGVAWSTSATYRHPDAAAAEALPPGRDQRTITARVTVGALDGPWVPSPGRPLALSLGNVEVEPAAGSMVLRGGELSPGLSYRVEAVVDAPRSEDVAAAGVPAGGAARPYLALPDPPWAFTEYARRITFGASTPFEQAVAIEYAVREGAAHDASAPAGSSYARLETFLFREPGSEAGAGAGTSEQFASAFAVLARAVGLPTRVVVGFTAGGEDGEGGRVVRGTDARAWPEVYFERLGWYAFDPTPRPRAGGIGEDDALKLEALDRIGRQAEVAAPGATSGPVVGATPAAVPGHDPRLPLNPRVVAAVGGLAVLAALASILAGRGLRRRRHRRAGDPGAWSEVLDLLTLLGRPPPVARPAPAIAAELAGLAPVAGAATHPAIVIATAADRAAFAPERAGDGRGWPAVGELRRAVRSAVPLRRRAIWPLDPRPLLRRRPGGPEVWR